MPQGFDNPVVFLAFANAAEQGYLSQLKKESALLRDLFLPLHRAGQVELVREESLDAAELPKLLNQYKSRITLFHYGGHANGSELSLEGGGWYIAGLAQLLRQIAPQEAACGSAQDGKHEADDAVGGNERR